MKTLLLLLLYFITSIVSGQDPEAKDNRYLRERVAQYKKDIRGPYRDIRWFCKDGSIRQPKDPCPEEIGPGLQHARLKEEVLSLGTSNHIFFGQILAATNFEEFWDAPNDQSRIQQYLLEQYLQSVDNGWIMHKGQFYRGALQAEDEATWGIAFYTKLLESDRILEANYFLIRQSLKSVPHYGDGNLGQLMRSQSKIISDDLPGFMDLRIKIHGRPEISDIQSVKNFRQQQSVDSPEADRRLKELIATMEEFYKPVAVSALLPEKTLLTGTPLGNSIAAYIANNPSGEAPANLIPQTAQLLMEIREGILAEKRGGARLELLDISILLEEILFKNAATWNPETLKEQLYKMCNLGLATAGTGSLELWEWERIQTNLNPPEKENITLEELTHILETARGAVEWSAAMVKATYGKTVSIYAAFEPLAYGFIDDRIRGSIALPLGHMVSELGEFMARASALTNNVLGIPGQSTVRGLNAGYAFGELVVVDGASEDTEVASDKIYIFQRAPSDLKPVAGIATVAEGNLVSHVQLLARNLGIPNTSLSDENLRDLKKYHGQKVFYAVTSKGNVVMKSEADMTSRERDLFLVKERSNLKIAIPVDKIRLDQKGVLNLREVDAGDSGSLCGPKAANLGQLKKMFPEMVVEGLVIPFGIFRDHMGQRMPGAEGTYWEYLTEMFAEADRMRSEGISGMEVENYQLRQLEVLREAIRKMPLRDDFVARIEQDFKTILGDDMGRIPVFLRSDTNMEDLKDFTGAGLNLTIFNVLDKDKILEGIRAVWASPYTERSFKWRQKYLLNPENVYPSILVIPSVDVDYSGVLITKGINSGKEDDLTVAFSRGAGGAVDGQAAETYTLGQDGENRLLAPAREAYYNVLPETGGTGRKATTFEVPVLKVKNMEAIRQLAKTIRETLPKATGNTYRGAYDVELGFKNNQLWLFQVRPFVENKNASASEYLGSITPKINAGRKIAMNARL